MKRVKIIFSLLLIFTIAIYVIKKNSIVDVENNIFSQNDILINELKEYREKVDSEEIRYRNVLQVGEDILGEEITEYIKYFNIEKVDVDIELSENLITLIPYPDVLETQKVYFKNGKLVMFVYISNTIGGEVIYYFDNDILVEYEVKYEELVEYAPVDSDLLLQRANYLYNNYLNTEYKVEIGKIEENIMDEKGSIVYKMIYNYPIINAKHKNENVKSINEELRKEIQLRFDKMKIPDDEKPTLIELYSDYVKNFSLDIKPEPFRDELDFEVKYNDNNIISICFNNVSFSGGAYPNSYSEGINYDMLTGKKIIIHEYFDIEKEKLYDIILNKMIEKYIESDEQYIDNSQVIEDNMEHIKYYFTNEGVYFFFQQYVVGPHALGEPFVIVSYKELGR